MKVRFYYSSKHTPFRDPSNEGLDLDGVLRRLRELEDQGVITCDLVDTSELSAYELQKAYSEAIWPSVAKGYTGYNVSRVFGGRRSKGANFGKEVLALVVYQQESENPEDVFPHRMGQATVSIMEFLNSLA